MWRSFVVVKIRISKMREIHFYLTFGFLGFKVVKKWMMNLFKESEDFGFSNFIWLDWTSSDWIELHPKLCPTVSSIGAFNYNLAHFCCDLLSPLVPNGYSCKDTFSFVSQIKNANLSKKCLVSYGVTSLFTLVLFKKPLT